MSPNNQLIYEYCNHISQYADGRFSIQQVEDDINFKNILNSIISNNDGKISVTNYEVLEYKSGISSVVFVPLSGRMHQIRIHMSDLGNPII